MQKRPRAGLPHSLRSVVYAQHVSREGDSEATCGNAGARKKVSSSVKSPAMPSAAVSLDDWSAAAPKDAVAGARSSARCLELEAANHSWSRIMRKVFFFLSLRVTEKKIKHIIVRIVFREHQSRNSLKKSGEKILLHWGGGSKASVLTVASSKRAKTLHGWPAPLDGQTTQWSSRRAASHAIRSSAFRFAAPQSSR